MNKKQRDQESLRGYNDCLEGKPIDAFYNGKGRLKESRRAIYEIGWRAAKVERQAVKEVVKERNGNGVE